MLGQGQGWARTVSRTWRQTGRAWAHPREGLGVKDPEVIHASEDAVPAAMDDHLATHQRRRVVHPFGERAHAPNMGEFPSSCDSAHNTHLQLRHRHGKTFTLNGTRRTPWRRPSSGATDGNPSPGHEVEECNIAERFFVALPAEYEHT